MASTKIDVLGPGDVAIISGLYNRIFTPPRDEEFFRERFQGRRNVTLLVAVVEESPIGFAIGFELMPKTYFCWLCGVVPEMRRNCIATQLIRAQHAWAQDHGYTMLRFECPNQHRTMLHVAITEVYDLVGIRWDTATGNKVVVF